MSEESKGEEIKHDDDAERLARILEVVKERVPKLIGDTLEAVFGQEPKGSELGKEAANFYKELRTAGMAEDHAFLLTRELIASRDRKSLLREMMGQINFSGGRGGGPAGPDRGKALQQAEEIRKELQAAEVRPDNAAVLRAKVQNWYRALRTFTGKNALYQQVAQDLTESWAKGDQARVDAIKRSIKTLSEFQETLGTK